MSKTTIYSITLNSRMPILTRGHAGPRLEEFIENRLIRKTEFIDNFLDGKP